MAVKSLSRSGLQASDATNSMLAGYSASDFELIQTVILGSSAASVTFSNLGTGAAAYKHLHIRCSAVETAGGGIDSLIMRFNGDTAANYAWHGLAGINTTASSSAGASSSTPYIAFINGDGVANLRFSPIIIDILDFASTSKTKTSRSLSGALGAVDKGVTLKSTLWNSTAAITSIVLSGASGNLDAGSRFSLYGIK